MRIITSLILASVIGSAATGALRHFMSSAEEEKPGRIWNELFQQDRSSAMRLFEKATSACMPELTKLQTNNARKFFPRMIAMRVEMSRKSGETLSEKDKALINREVHKILLIIPNTDAALLANASKKLDVEKATILKCIFKTFGELATKVPQKKTKDLFSDTQLRGS